MESGELLFSHQHGNEEWPFILLPSLPERLPCEAQEEVIWSAIAIGFGYLM